MVPEALWKCLPRFSPPPQILPWLKSCSMTRWHVMIAPTGLPAAHSTPSASQQGSVLYLPARVIFFLMWESRSVLSRVPHLLQDELKTGSAIARQDSSLLPLLSCLLFQDADAFSPFPAFAHVGFFSQDAFPAPNLTFVHLRWKSPLKPSFKGRLSKVVLTVLGLELAPPSRSPSVFHYAGHESHCVLLTCFHNKPQGKEIS